MNQQTNEEIWREEFEEPVLHLMVISEDIRIYEKQLERDPSGRYTSTHMNAKWSGYLAARKKAQEENNYRCNDMSGVCLNCGARHPEESSCLAFWVNHYNDSLRRSVKIIQSLKDELKTERAAVDFYAGKWNWKTNSGRPYNIAENGNYLTICGDFEILRLGLNHRVGGKLARETQAKRKAGL